MGTPDDARFGRFVLDGARFSPAAVQARVALVDAIRAARDAEPPAAPKAPVDQACAAGSALGDDPTRVCSRA
jgi:hypothetical protein